MFIHGKGFKRPNGDDLTDLTYDFSKVKVLMFLECVLQLSYNIKRSAATAKLSSSKYFAMLDMLREFTAKQRDVQVNRAKASAL